MRPTEILDVFSSYLLPAWAQMQQQKTIKLNEPNKKRGLPVMEALSRRQKIRGNPENKAGRAEGLSNRLKTLNLISDAIVPEKGSKIGH
jgi:hypothetical protein